MLTAITLANVAIALLCFGLTWPMARFTRRVNQLDRDLKRWTVLLEDALTGQTLALIERRGTLRQWQLIYLQCQLQQRRLSQLANLLRLLWLMRQRRFL